MLWCAHFMLIIMLMFVEMHQFHLSKWMLRFFFSTNFFSIRLVLMTIFFLSPPKIFNFLINNNLISTIDPQLNLGDKLFLVKLILGTKKFWLLFNFFSCCLKNIFIHHSKMVNHLIDSGSTSDLMIKLWLLLIDIGLWW